MKLSRKKALLIIMAAFVCLIVIFMTSLSLWFHKIALSLQTVEIIHELQLALRTYKLEYNGWPLPSHMTDEAMVHRCDEKLISVLMEENPRQIKFMDLRDTLIKNGFVDRWGEAPYFMLDQNGDGMIKNPSLPESSPPHHIESSVIVYSSGPDKNPDTWEDNVTSW